MNKLIIAFVFLLPAVTACSDGSGREPQPVAETMVNLEGAIGLSTRAVIDSGYEVDLNIYFARQDETGNTYGAWNLYKAVRSGGAGNRPILFEIPQLYPADGSHIRLHGYYPVEDRSDWFVIATGLPCGERSLRLKRWESIHVRSSIARMNLLC